MDALNHTRSGMELFEEALRRWEEALNFRSRLADDEAECASVKMGAGDAIAEETVEVCDLYRCTVKLLRFFSKFLGGEKTACHAFKQDIISGEFIRKLESLLQRAYRLQEEFEGAVGFTDPSSHHSGESVPPETQEGSVFNTEHWCEI